MAYKNSSVKEAKIHAIALLYAACPYNKSESALGFECPEVTLWFAVLAQAVKEIGNSHKPWTEYVDSTREFKHGSMNNVAESLLIDTEAMMDILVNTGLMEK